MEKKKMGRPFVPQEKRICVQITVAMTVAERETIRAIAAKRRLTPSQLLMLPFRKGKNL
jgi:hypothetical protein